METLSNALPQTPEQWIAALATLIVAIVGLFKRKQPASREPERDPEH